MGDNTIHYMAVTMMGAVQPFISGDLEDRQHAEDVSVEDVEQLHIDAEARRRRSPSTATTAGAQPLSAEEDRGGMRCDGRCGSGSSSVIVQEPVRRSCRTRNSKTFSFRVADTMGYDGRRVRGRPSALGHTCRSRVPRSPASWTVRHLGEPRPAVRRAARGVRADVHQPALRAGGHDRRP